MLRDTLWQYDIKLKGLSVKNFKSYKDAKIKLNNFNVVVGPNASGKTNFIEIFSLLRKIYVEKEINPFFEWWGYDNVVWKRDEKLPIHIKLNFEIYGNDVTFETVFTGIGGEFQILKEKIDVKDILSLEKNREKLKLKHDEKFLENALSKLKSVDFMEPVSQFEKFIKERKKEYIIEQEIIIKIKREINIFDFGSSAGYSFFENFALAEENYSEQQETHHKLFILSPAIKEKRSLMVKGELKNEFMMSPLIGTIRQSIKNLFIKTMILKGLKITEMKSPVRVKKDFRLLEDGSNIQNILYNLFLKDNMLPENIALFISNAFQNTKIKFEPTTDGRILLKLYEGNFELNPPNISDGFFKMLTLLTALETEPYLLIIDEIENSLHPEAISRIIDNLKNSDSMVIVSTHSPAVVDLTLPNDLILLEKDFERKTILRKIEKNNKIKKKLRELGITMSEGWLYGKL